MDVDISFMEEQSTVIWCRTKDEAQELMDSIISVYPSVRSQLEPKVERFECEKDREGLGFRFDRHPERYDIGYGRMYYYRNGGYRIIEFNDLVVVSDYGDIVSGYSNSSAALAALF